MTPLEMKNWIRSLEERISALEGDKKLEAEKTRSALNDSIVQMTYVGTPTVFKEDEKKTNKKLCPHCGEQPAYFFHVRKCAKNKNNKGVNGEANRD